MSTDKPDLILLTCLYRWWMTSVDTPLSRKQKAQLLQRDRATLRVIEYIVKWLKITQGHSKWHCWAGRVLVHISISLKLCLYVVPFLRYSASKNGVNGVRVVQDHWKWRRSIDHTTLSRVSILTRDIDIANISVCPSVCLSVTFRYQMKTA